jgi:serine protease Do
MQRQIKHYLLALLALFCFNTTLQAETPPNASIAPMLQTVLPTVVNIKAQIKITDLATWRELQKQQRSTSNDDTLPRIFVSVASGVIVDAAKGYILTNAHVINDAQTIIVTLGDGRHFNAKVVGADRPSDVALIQIKAKNLKNVVLGDSNTVKVGDFVAAIGNPFGLSQSVTSGIVSALGRSTLGIENYENFIQTDAPINPGNSGGALINMQGQLIGINTAIIAPSQGSVGIGFAIPINMAKSVMDQLINFGNVKRGLLGIGAQDLTPDLANAFHSSLTQGAAITQILPNSPAQISGLQVGDIIAKINNSSIKNASDVVNTVGFLRVDSHVNIEVYRNNKSIQISVNLTDPKKREAISAEKDPFFYGVTLKDFSITTPDHGNVLGVLVVDVKQDTSAWQADLRPGDVITSLNQQPINSIADLFREAKKADSLVLLNVYRGNNAVFLVLNKDN